jgi:hypothetical protein
MRVGDVDELYAEQSKLELRDDEIGKINVAGENWKR